MIVNSGGVNIDALKTLLGGNGKTCRIETGSYVGTGVYGQNNPNTIQCGFTPAVLMIPTMSYGQWNLHTAIRGTSNWGDASLLIIWGDSSVSWYNANGSNDQLNASGVTYYYVVLGYDE